MTRRAAFGFATPVFYVADLIAARDFYSRVLGFTVDTCWPDGDPQVLMVDHGDAHLMFVREDDATQRSCRSEVRIETHGVAELHKHLASRVTVEWGPEVYFYGRREFSVRDPNGVSVIFTEETADEPGGEG